MSHSLADIRREYSKKSFDRSDCTDNPLDLLRTWFDAAIEAQCEDPTAMVLSTLDEKGGVDARVVLAKDIDAQGITFFTNYDSEKGRQMAAHPQVSLTFYWSGLSRQVRIQAHVAKITREESERYFATRPKTSQIAAAASQQSHVLPDREALQASFDALSQQYQDEPVPCPEQWGGYRVTVDAIEFWQGRESRMHDRFRYEKKGNAWLINRLAP